MVIPVKLYSYHQPTHSLFLSFLLVSVLSLWLKVTGFSNRNNLTFNPISPFPSSVQPALRFFPFHCLLSIILTHQYSRSPSIFITTSIYLSPIIPLSFPFCPPYHFIPPSLPHSISHLSLSLCLSIHFPLTFLPTSFIVSFPFLFMPHLAVSLSILVSVFVIITKIRVSSAIIYLTPPERREISKATWSQHRGPVLHLGNGEEHYGKERRMGGVGALLLVDEGGLGGLGNRSG